MLLGCFEPAVGQSVFHDVSCVHPFVHTYAKDVRRAIQNPHEWQILSTWTWPNMTDRLVLLPFPPTTNCACCYVMLYYLKMLSDLGIWEP